MDGPVTKVFTFVQIQRQGSKDNHFLFARVCSGLRNPDRYSRALILVQCHLLSWIPVEQNPNIIMMQCGIARNSLILFTILANWRCQIKSYFKNKIIFDPLNFELRTNMTEGKIFLWEWNGLCHLVILHNYSLTKWPFWDIRFSDGPWAIQ